MPANVPSQYNRKFMPGFDKRDYMGSLPSTIQGKALAKENYSLSIDNLNKHLLLLHFPLVGKCVHAYFS
jgi:hypothetical protein